MDNIAVEGPSAKRQKLSQSPGGLMTPNDDNVPGKNNFLAF